MTTVLPSPPSGDAAEPGVERICPFCQAVVASAQARQCPTCGSGYHDDCWSEGGGCGIVGCGAQRPRSDQAAPAVATTPIAHHQPAPRPLVAAPPRAPQRMPQWLRTRPWQVAALAVVIFGFPAIGAFGAVNNWFSGVTGTVYSQEEVDAIRTAADDAGEARGERAGYADGYDEGVTAGYDEGFSDGGSEGYDAGHADGYDQGFDDGYDEGDLEGYDRGYSAGEADGGVTARSEGYDAGYDDGYEMGEIDGHAQGYSDGLSDSYDFDY